MCYNPAVARLTPKEEARLWAVAETVRRAVARGPYRSPVATNSMGPLAREGDAFELTAPGRRPRFGDVVAAVAGRAAVMHRVIGRRRGFLILKGDASPRADPPVYVADVLARATALRKADGRRVSFDTRRARLVAAALAALSFGENVLAGVAGPAATRKWFYLVARVICLALPA